MPYNPDIHHRHSIRLKNYDYSQNGAYFVTICAWQRQCLFGEIVDGGMVFNDMGRIVADEWKKTAHMRSNIELDVSAIMPNHFHGIIIIHDNVGAHCMRPSPIHPEPVNKNQLIINSDNMQTNIKDRARVGAPLHRRSGSIGSIVAGFKSATTKQINQYRTNPGCPVWHKNYYERVIRNENELSRAREYIVNNPLKWELDKDNPVNCP